MMWRMLQIEKEAGKYPDPHVFLKKYFLESRWIISFKYGCLWRISGGIEANQKRRNILNDNRDRVNQSEW